MEKLRSNLPVGHRFFGTNFFFTGNRSRINAHRITEYLVIVRGIQVYEDFPVQLVSIHQQSYSNIFNISMRTVEAIVDACELFTEYIYDMNELVCNEIFTMAKIHTCVLSKKQFSRQLIRTKDNLPESLQVIVLKNGFVQVTDSH